MLGIDPGSAKCGLAVVESSGTHSEILFRKVVPTEELSRDVQELNEQFQPDLVVIGDGTKSKDIQVRVRAALPGKSLLVVDEQDTSVRARERYWIENPRRWWRRLLPSTLQVPPHPVDDYVAVILAERAFNVTE